MQRLTHRAWQRHLANGDCGRGWVVPVVCAALMMGAGLLAALFQQTLSEQERATMSRWQLVQAQSAGEGLVGRVLPLLDEKGSVDESCRISAPVAAPAGHAPPEESHSPFSAALLKAGATVSCLVDLQGPAGSEAWRCHCPVQNPITTVPPLLPDRVLSPSAWAELRVEPGAVGQWRVTVHSYTVQDVESKRLPGPIWSAQLLLKQDAGGVWREAVGSWADQP